MTPAAATLAPRVVVRVTPTNELITSGDRVEAVSCTFPWSSWPHREYIIQVQSSNNHDGQEAEICKTRLRFSEFYRRFSTGYFGRPSTLLPTLPTRGWGLLSNYTTNETNVQHRSKAIKNYLFWVLNHSGAPTVEVCQALEISEQGQATIREIAKLQQQEVTQVEEERRRKVEAARQIHQEQQRKAQALERSRWEQAQTLPVGDARCSLRFPISREFEMHTRWFSFGGDANIRSGPGDRAWFFLERTDFPKILPFSDITYELRTAQGKPLLEMKERFRMWDYMCDLYYITSSGVRVQAAKVHREFQFAFLEETYTITTANAVNGRFLCTGGWWNLCIKVDERTVAKVQRHLFSVTDGYTLKIFPNQDSILLLGICCAIGRIHAAIKSRNS